MAISIGAPAIDRSVSIMAGSTQLAVDNPANASGTIDTLEIWANQNINNLEVGTFYNTAGNNYKCRDSVLIGAVTAGSMQTFAGLSINVQLGDYIGAYWSATGKIEEDDLGGLGRWWVFGEFIDPGDETTYALSDADIFSLHGIGTEAAVGLESKSANMGSKMIAGKLI